MGRWTRWTWGASATVGLLLAASTAAAETVISGVVADPLGKPLSGLALLERGALHGNKWYRGGFVDGQGRFRIVVESGGDYGLHVYANGYIYHPRAVQVQADKTLDVRVTLVPSGTRANDPIIRRVGFFPWERDRGRTTFVKVDVTDPNNDLGPQVLALNTATAEVFALDPPQRVRNLKANFPNGVYQVQYDTSKRAITPKEWYFVIADHQCNTSDILAYPHEPKPSKVVAAAIPTGPLSAATGEMIFKTICALCHHPDKADVKIGPGLKGLFKGKDLPASGKPVSEANVADQIRNGSGQMPPLRHLGDQNIQSLLLYLKML